MLDLNNTEAYFNIPEAMIGKTPCQVSPILYEDPALEIDLDDAEWLSLDSLEQHARLESKRAAEAAAIAACNTCPLLIACQEWAMKAGDGVFGVVGGTTLEERIGAPISRVPVDTRLRGPLGQVRDDLIEEWTEQGASNRIIAQRLGCNIRTVERRKAKLAAGTAKRFDGSTNLPEEVKSSKPSLPLGLKFIGEPVAISQLMPSDKSLSNIEGRGDVANNDIVPARVSPETALIFDMLIDGGLRDRNVIIDSLISSIDEDLALSSAPEGRFYADNEAKIQVGARKFIMNRIDIAVRRGRILSMKTESGKILICLEKNVSRVWRNSRGTSSE